MKWLFPIQTTQILFETYLNLRWTRFRLGFPAILQHIRSRFALKFTLFLKCLKNLLINSYFFTYETLISNLNNNKVKSQKQKKVINFSL